MPKEKMATTIDVEDQSILSTIFKDSFPDAWRDNPEFAEYLAELSSYGVDRLSGEPERLAEERRAILEQTQDLAFHNYKTFIQTAECSREIFQDFQIIERHVGSMLEKLPALSEECGTFLTRAQEINVSRRMNTLTLARHTSLLEVLELPQLMDTCVRNGYYEEALELAAHVRRLGKKHGSIPVIATIVSEVEHSCQLMLSQLIQQLRCSLQLPQCLRVIGYLRRMDVFTEPELRIKFLQARDAWLQGILSAIPKDDPYYHISKTVEASRVHLFDIITQYRAIFSDDDPLVATARDDAPSDSALFHGWVVQKVSAFLHTLESDLSRGVGGRLDSVLGQCMYFGLSFSRVGADFRGLLAPIFQKAALASFTDAIQQADNRFDEAMQSYTLLGTPAMLPSSAFTLATQGSGTLQPPVSLLEFAPVAAYCNSVLSAFKELRLCAPLSLASSVARHMQTSLEKAARAILAYHRAEEATFNAGERGRFGDLCQAFSQDLVSHLNKCLQTMFPPTQLAQMLGISVIDLIKIGNIGIIDAKVVNAPLQHLIPAKPEEPEAVIGQLDDEKEAVEKSSQPDDTRESNKLEITEGSSQSEIIKESNDSEITKESSQPEITTDSSQSEIEVQSGQSETVIQSSESATEAAETSSQSQTLTQPSMAETTAKSDQSDAVLLEVNDPAIQIEDNDKDHSITAGSDLTEKKVIESEEINLLTEITNSQGEEYVPQAEENKPAGEENLTTEELSIEHSKQGN